MSLESFKRTSLTWNRANDTLNKLPIEIVAGDTNARTLELYITNDGDTDTLSGYDVRLYWSYADATSAGIATFIADDLNRGIYTLTFPTEMTVPGTILANISLENKDEKSVIVSKQITFNVITSQVNKTAVEVTNRIDEFKQLLLTIYPNSVATELSAQKAQIDANASNILLKANGSDLTNLKNQIDQISSELTSFGITPKQITTIQSLLAAIENDATDADVAAVIASLNTIKSKVDSMANGSYTAKANKTDLDSLTQTVNNQGASIATKRDIAAVDTIAQGGTNASTRPVAFNNLTFIGTNPITAPLLNMVKGSRTAVSVVGNNSVNQGNLLYAFDNGSTLANQNFGVGDNLTVEFDWVATNPVSGNFILQWQGVPWGIDFPSINISSSNGSGHVKYTFAARTTDNNGIAPGIGYRLDNVPTNTTVTFSKLTVRNTSASQPWMPAPSEALSTDYASYDTPANWIALGSGYAWYTQNNALNNQPGQHGHLIQYNHPTSNELLQIFSVSPTGETYYRKANSTGWQGRTDNGGTWTRLSDSRNPLPVFVADPTSTSSAYTITNSIVSNGLQNGYIFKFIPNVTSSTTSATLSINGGAPSTFYRLDSYSGVLVSMTSNNAWSNFLGANNVFTVTNVNGKWLLTDLPLANTAAINGTLSIPNGGLGNTIGMSQSVNGLSVTINSFAVGGTIVGNQTLANNYCKLFGNTSNTTPNSPSAENLHCIITSNGSGGMEILAYGGGSGNAYMAWANGTYSGSTFTITSITNPWYKLLSSSGLGIDYAQAHPVGSVVSNTSSSSSGYAVGTWSSIGSTTVGSTTVYYWKRTG